MYVLIETVTLDDYAAFYRVFDAVAQEGKFFAEVKAPPSDKLKFFFDKLIKENYPFLIAKSCSEVVGWGHLYPFSGFSYSHNFCFAVAVLKEFRGLGIGHKLSIQLLNIVKTNWAECKTVRIEVISENSNAIKLYTKIGFTIDGERKCFVQQGDKFKDVTYLSLDMKKFLYPSPLIP